MLVLSRQRDETIMIGDDIEITIVDIRGDKVRLGITAPATIPVHRKEVYDAIQRENREAARMKMEDIGNFPKAGRPSVPPGLHRPAATPPTTQPGTPAPQNNPAGPSSAPGAPGSAPSAPSTPPTGPVAASPLRMPAVRPGGPGSRGPSNGTGNGSGRGGPAAAPGMPGLAAGMNNSAGSMTA
jgi:carbon storage regulator